MKVGIVGIGGGAVGMTTYQRTLLEGLRDRTNHDVTFVAPDAEVAYTLPRSSPFRAFANFAGSPDPRLRKAVRDANADVYLVNAAWPMPRGIKRWVAVVAEAVVDETAAWGVYRSSQRRLGAKYLYRALDGASGVVAISEFTRDRLRDTLGLTDVAVAPPALLGFDGTPTQAWDFSPYVTVVGWFHPRKNLPLALEAWKRALARGLDRDLVLVGLEGPDDRRNGSVARRILETCGPELAKRVHQTDAVSRPDLGRILEGTEALMITSTYEGFGIPALEAFSFGKPVVAVDSGSLVDIVPPHGTVTPSDPEAIAEALLRAVREPPDAAPLIAYAKSFSVERQVRPVIDLLERLTQ